MVDTDLIVVGGGPVGLATALYAVRAGLSVTVLEPRRAPIDKACGEGLMPGALLALERLGVQLGGHPFWGIRYVDGTRSVTADFRDGPGRGVRRTDLHLTLSAAAATAGAELVPQAMAAVSQSETGVLVTLAGGATVSARYVVAADGLHSPTRRLLGLEAPAAAPRRHGLRRHVRTVPWTDHVEVHWAEAAEAYVTPVGDGLVGVAVLTSTRGGWADQLTGFPRLLERLVDAEPASEVRGAGPLRQRVTSRARGRVLLVGDAGGYVDALTGEGIAVGLAQAEAAVRAVAADTPGRYPAEAAGLSRTSTVLTAGLLAATRGRAGRRLVLRTATTAPWLFDRAVNALAHPARTR